MAGYRLANVRILILDDSDNMRLLLRTVLEELGARLIAEASNTHEAWDRLRGFRPDIVLCDWELKSGTGLAFVQRLRGAPDSPNPFLPVILVSGYAEVSRVIQARDAGVTEYLAKPVHAHALYARIRSLIEKPRFFIDTATFFGPDRRRHEARDDARWPGPERRTRAIPESEILRL